MNKLYAILLALPLLALAQQDDSKQAPAATPQQPPKPCASDKYRQFDFWLGSWDVTEGDKPAGHNEVRLLHGGCVVTESWTSATGGFTGSSLNIYDRASDQWHQTWVDTSGTLLELNGDLQGNEMVLSGRRRGPDGKENTHRITWTPNPDGTVRQHWEVSADGDNWQTLFDGLYHRVAAAE